MKALKLDLCDIAGNVTEQLPPNLDLQYGSTGFVYLGLFAFVYGQTKNGKTINYVGEMKWINSKHCIFFPEAQEMVTSFACYLKPGVHMKPTVLDRAIEGTAGLQVLANNLSALKGKLP